MKMNRIKELRKRDGINQGELAEVLCVKRSAVSKYETGATPLTDETIIRLAKYFDVSTDRVLGYCPFNDEQLSSLRKFLIEAVRATDIADAVDSNSMDLFNLMHDIADGKILPTYEDVYQIADEWRFSLDEMFGNLDIVKWQQKKLVTMVDDELSVEFSRICGQLSRDKQAAAVQFLRVLLSSGEAGTP